VIQEAKRGSGLQGSITIAKVDAVFRTIRRVLYDFALDRPDELASREQA
jgi:hypothetical protein